MRRKLEWKKLEGKKVAMAEAQNEDAPKAKAGEEGARPAGSAMDTMKRMNQTGLLRIEEKQKSEGMRRESEEVRGRAEPLANPSLALRTTTIEAFRNRQIRVPHKQKTTPEGALDSEIPEREQHSRKSLTKSST